MTSEVLSKSKFNVYGAITAKIVRGIKEAKGKYVMPWHTGETPLTIPINAVSGNPYQGVNVLSLWLDAAAKGFRGGYWASYKQWQSVGGQVRRGETGSIVVFYKELERTDEQKEKGELARLVAKAYWVFNAAQVDNWIPPEPERKSTVEIDEEVAAFIEALGAKIDHGFVRACYRIDPDRIEMPCPGWFFDTPTSTATESYHAVLLHELTHWSGAAHRTGRNIGQRFGSNAYAFEELVAELGAAFLCAAFGIANEPREDHAAYVASWLEVLGNDSKAIFTAARHAREAVEYLCGIAGEKLRWFEAAPTMVEAEQSSAQ